MTSILEALRELEEERRRTRASQTVSVADAPAEPARSSLVYPLVAGLAVGVLIVGLVVWWIGIGTPPAAPDAAPAAASPTPTATASPARPLAWLEQAEAPQARVRRATPTPDPHSAGDAGSAPSSPPAPAAAAPRAGHVVLESVRFATAPERRSVILRVDGRRVTLRQGERAGGIEVQLILENGAYLNRGSDVFFAVPEG